MAINLSLEVAKYSYTTSLNTDKKCNWSHVKDADTMVTLHGHRANGSLMLRVVQGTITKDKADVADLVDRAISMRLDADRQGVTLRTDSLPIFGITKDFLLALRWRLDEVQSRRIQLRLRSEADCEHIVSILAQRGMEFSDHRPGTARPATAVSRPESSYNDFRPLTAQSSSPFFSSEQTSQRQPQSSYRQSTVETSRPAFGAPSHVERTQPPTSIQEPTSRPQISVPRFFTRDESTAPREIVPERPTTAQHWRSHTMQPPRSNDVYEFQRRDPGERFEERPSSTSHAANLDAIRRAVEDHDSSSNAGSDTRPVSAFQSQQQWSSGPTELSRPLPSSPGSFGQRPQTAASATSLTTVPPDNRGQPMSIQRDESFKRSGSHSGGSSRPGSSALSLPPLQRPKLVKAAVASPDRNALRPNTTRPASSRPTIMVPPVHTRYARPDEASASPNRLGDVSVARQESPSSPDRLSVPVNTDLGLSRRPGPMNDLLYGSKSALTERSPNAGVPRMNSIADAPHEIESPPPSVHHFPKAVDVAPPQNNDPPQQAIVSAQPSVEDWSLDRYATLSKADREALLDDFMIENLENPSFTTLCEDVENCWRRIALGL